jgi:hypothetical protein
MEDKVFCKDCKHRKPDEYYAPVNLCRRHFTVRYNPVYGGAKEYEFCESVNKNYDCTQYEKRTALVAVRQFFEECEYFW